MRVCLKGALDLGTMREVGVSRLSGGAGRKLPQEGDGPPCLVPAVDVTAVLAGPGELRHFWSLSRRSWDSCGGATSQHPPFFPGRLCSQSRVTTCTFSPPEALLLLSLLTPPWSMRWSVEADCGEGMLSSKCCYSSCSPGPGEHRGAPGSNTGSGRAAIR